MGQKSSSEKKLKRRSPGATLSAQNAGTKIAVLTRMLRAKKGATIDELAAKTGWQPHSVRGCLSGTLKKKKRLTILSEKVPRRGRVYRIADAKVDVE